MNRYVFKSNDRGFTLPEALISWFIFSAVTVIFAAALGTNFKVLLVADQRTTAETLARAQLEAINNAPYDFTPPYEYDKITGIPYGYVINSNGADANHISVTLINPETGAVSATDLGVQKVTCSVTCPGGQFITVEAYKR